MTGFPYASEFVEDKPVARRGDRVHVAYDATYDELGNAGHYVLDRDGLTRTVPADATITVLPDPWETGDLLRIGEREVWQRDGDGWHCLTSQTWSRGGSQPDSVIDTWTSDNVQVLVRGGKRVTP